MEMDLENMQWGEFVFENIFKIKSTNSGIDKNKLNDKKGDIPYITRSDKNNGIDFFIGSQNEKFKKDNGNVITIGLDTQTVFYQSHSFYTGQNIQILSNESLNYFSAQFIIPLIKIQMEKFNWGGNGATLTRLKRSKLILPTNSKGEPDYTFMEQFMLKKEKDKINTFHNYISKKIELTKNYKVVKPLDQKTWGVFNLMEVFTKIQRGKRLKKDDHLKGLVPYVSSSAINNGIDGFVSNTESVRIFKNCLTLANSGSVGSTFFQPFAFVASDHITHLENNNFNEFIYLFISSISKRLSEKYSFNREINDTRIQREKIVLPSDDNGNPDYDYMENYIKRLEYQKLRNYLEFKSLCKY